MERVIFDYSKLNGRIREKLGTQKKFAEVMGLSCASISSKLTNKTYFDQAEIDRAMRVLGIDPGAASDYFFTVGIKKT